MTAPAAPVKPAAAGYTLYSIISRLDEAGRIVYIHEKDVSARSAEAAIRTYAQAMNSEGSFIAIPARSFKAVKVTAQTVTTLKLESA